MLVFCFVGYSALALWWRGVRLITTIAQLRYNQSAKGLDSLDPIENYSNRKPKI